MRARMPGRMRPINVLCLLSLAGHASAETDISSIGYVGFIFGALALLYTYAQTQTKNGLDRQIRRDRSLLHRLKNEINEAKGDLEKIRFDTKSITDEMDRDEIRRIEGAPKNNKKTASLRGDYWERIDELSHDAGHPSRQRLEEDKRDIETMIEMTKAKYHTRAIDEKTYTNIIEEYQKKMIEIEAKMKKLEGKK
jgi:hypothetical protein